jgi:hypothetical protein
MSLESTVALTDLLGSENVCRRIVAAVSRPLLSPDTGSHPKLSSWSCAGTSLPETPFKTQGRMTSRLTAAGSGQQNGHDQPRAVAPASNQVPGG